MLGEKILEILAQNDREVSGEIIAKELKVSRTSVWKTIKRLTIEGFDISSSKRGYILKNKDILLPSRIRALMERLTLWDRLVYKFEVSSTMNLAKEFAEKGIRALVIAEKQNTGRGRLGRSWISPQGGLWITLVLLDKIPLRESFVLTFLSALAVTKALEQTFGLKPKLKWPNDVLLEGKKVAGILLELKGETDRVDYALVGVGINLNNRVKDLPFEVEAISVSEYLGKPVDRNQVLSALLLTFQNLFLNLSKNQVITEWRNLAETIGSKVRIKTASETIEGVALDLDEDGALMVRTEGGIRKAYSGDCFHLRYTSL